MSLGVKHHFGAALSGCSFRKLCCKEKYLDQCFGLTFYLSLVGNVLSRKVFVLGESPNKWVPPFMCVFLSPFEVRCSLWGDALRRLTKNPVYLQLLGRLSV